MIPTKDQLKERFLRVLDEEYRKHGIEHVEAYLAHIKEDMEMQYRIGSALDLQGLNIGVGPVLLLYGCLDLIDEWYKHHNQNTFDLNRYVKAIKQAKV